MLNLYKLEIFNTVAIEGSFSKAAHRLLLTQPAVSQHIHDLEASLKVDLFNRSSRGVQLTPAGETLLDYTRCILRLLAEAESALTQIGQLEDGQILIGATPGASVYLLPEWIQSFHHRFPNLSVRLSTSTTGEIAAGLSAQALDLGFVEGELELEPPLNALVLRKIDLFLVVGAGHPWWSKERVFISDLENQPFITRPHGSQTRAWIDQVLQQHGVAPKIIAEFDNPESIKLAAASGMGIAILPEWGLSNELLAGKLRILPVAEVDFHRSLKLLWNDSAPLKPVSRSFLSHLIDLFPQLTRMVASGEDLKISLPLREEYKASLSCK